MSLICHHRNHTMSVLRAEGGPGSTPISGASLGKPSSWLPEYRRSTQIAQSQGASDASSNLQRPGSIEVGGAARPGHRGVDRRRRPGGAGLRMRVGPVVLAGRVAHAIGSIGHEFIGVVEDVGAEVPASQ